MTKLRLGLSFCTYACLAIGLAAMMFSLLWISLGGSDSAMFNNAMLMMYLSVAGAFTVSVIEIGATATHATYRRVAEALSSRIRGGV